MATMNAENNAGVLNTTAPRPGGVRVWLRGWRLVGLGALTLLVVLGIGYVLMMQRMQSGNTPPPGLDTSWTQTSTKGLYRSTVAPSLEPIAINQLHTWRLHVETADGQPVDDASITIHGDMPGHGHGLPTEPTVTQKLGNGDYLVEGMKFQMAGWWYVDVDINSAMGSDTVRFNFILK
ncbi:MAG: FixH family protein [Chloroflexota bacterium]|nr:FixH family protein [Chloroflexota bacterium]